MVVSIDRWLRTVVGREASSADVVEETVETHRVRGSVRSWSNVWVRCRRGWILQQRLQNRKWKLKCFNVELFVAIFVHFVEFFLVAWLCSQRASHNRNQFMFASYLCMSPWKLWWRDSMSRPSKHSKEVYSPLPVYFYPTNDSFRAILVFDAGNGI